MRDVQLAALRVVTAWLFDGDLGGAIATLQEVASLGDVPPYCVCGHDEQDHDDAHCTRESGVAACLRYVADWPAEGVA